jgi:hypothetical protein
MPRRLAKAPLNPLALRRLELVLLEPVAPKRLELALLEPVAPRRLVLVLLEPAPVRLAWAEIRLLSRSEESWLDSELGALGGALTLEGAADPAEFADPAAPFCPAPTSEARSLAAWLVVRDCVLKGRYCVELGEICTTLGPLGLLRRPLSTATQPKPGPTCARCGPAL